MRVLAIIPARGGSKGIHKKNIAICGGRPLICWTIDAVKNSRWVTDQILTTDCPDIRSIATAAGACCPFLRPASLSGDGVPTLPVIKHAVGWFVDKNNVDPDIVVILQPTSPLRTSLHVDQAISLLVNDTVADSLVSVVEVSHQFAPNSLMVRDGNYIKPWKTDSIEIRDRRRKGSYLARNGAAIYAFKIGCLRDKGDIYGEHILPYEMDQNVSVDVDNDFDMQICDLLLKNKR